MGAAGLTVFRDQQFGECMAGEGAARRRIEDVEKLRGAQVAERVMARDGDGSSDAEGDGSGER